MTQLHEPAPDRTVPRATTSASAFPGWLAAVGLTVLLGATVGGVVAGLRTGATPSPSVAVLVALTVLVVGYHAGGYVAGQCARAPRTAVIGVLVTVVAAIVAASSAARLVVLARHGRLPAAPLTAEQLTFGGVLVLVAITVVGTLLAVLPGTSAREGSRRAGTAGVDGMPGHPDDAA